MSFDKLELERLQSALCNDPQRFQSVPKRQKLRSFTVVCLILNRTIGSGIFVTPGKVLQGTNSVGLSLLFWPLGGFVAIAGLLVWLEFGLSTPRHEIQPGYESSVPRSGGEKNYIEYLLDVLGGPKFLSTCMYGIAFIILGNLSGNAVSFGSLVLYAAGHTNPSHGAVLGLAITSLTLACLLHVSSRRGGILVNNCFAVLKVVILVVIIVLGFSVSGGASFGGDLNPPGNFAPQSSFASPRSDVASYTDSFFFVVYTYSGFEQPFYVLGEVHRPKRNFAKATFFALVLTTVLFSLVNVAYLCAVPKDSPLLRNVNMGTLFFKRVFGTEVASRVMAALIAFSIFGNIVVMTFTASRVKQEIAKEGVLPFSTFFASGTTTPAALLKAWWSSRKDSSVKSGSQDSDVERHNGFEAAQLEQSPMAALLLHWMSSIFLIAVTARLTSSVAYSFLVSLYVYVIITLMGFVVSAGLVYLKLSRNSEWTKHASFRPWGGPTAALVYGVVCGFLLVTAFLRPTDGSPFSSKNLHLQWYTISAIGMSATIWGVIWFGGLHLVMWKRGQQLIVTRVPYIEQDEEDGEWVMPSEVIDFAWRSRIKRAKSGSKTTFE